MLNSSPRSSLLTLFITLHYVKASLNVRSAGRSEHRKLGQLAPSPGVRRNRTRIPQDGKGFWEMETMNGSSLNGHRDVMQDLTKLTKTSEGQFCVPSSMHTFSNSCFSLCESLSLLTATPVS
jgi:hypothetical protein